MYARVSTDDQADRGYSIPSQLDLCRKYAERMEFSVVEQLVEDHSGSVPIGDRPEGKKLVAMLKARQADALIVYQVDRLSRDIVNLLATVQLWIRAGIEVHSCDIGRIESELDIVLVIKGWQGSDERKKILERTMRGKRAKAESGKVVACGHSPYGYAYLRDDKGKIVSFEIVEEEARIVRLINRWYVFGDESERPLSATKIAARLSQMRVPTPGEAHGGYRRKRGAGMWNVHGIVSIISNELYVGVWRFNWRMGKAKIRRPLEETFVVRIPPIISRDIFALAQLQRKRNRELSRRNMKHQYLLRGLITCQCGRKMTGTVPNDTRHYACNWLFTHHTGVEQRTCFERHVRADVLEEDIWHEIEELFSDLDRVSNQLKAAQQEELDNQQPKRDELQALEANMALTERNAIALGQTLQALREIIESDPEGLVAQNYRKQIEEINELHRKQVKRCEELRAELTDQVLNDEAIELIMQYARDVKEGMQDLTFDGKRRVLEWLRVQITIKEDRYYLTCLLGSTDKPVRRPPRKRPGKKAHPSYPVAAVSSPPPCCFDWHIGASAADLDAIRVALRMTKPNTATTSGQEIEAARSG
ncbi:MAG: recombinase family protein [Chloroflexi bacterium]|nr:recombinase family protein [Chloroflexota bacterium]